MSASLSLHGDLILPLSACRTEQAHLVGGKALGLGQLTIAGFDIPDGFVVTTHAYRRAVNTSGAQAQITTLLNGASGSAADQETLSQRLRELFVAEVIDDALRDAIRVAYEAMGSPPVAVRSSALAEDRADASFAGQQDTFLWIQGADEVVTHVLRCWASLFSTRVLTYRDRLGIEPDDVAMAVVVQKMVPARSAGVMMSLDPVTGDRDTIYVESSYGLGEAVVAGEVSPDGFWLAKHDLSVHRRTLGSKQIAYHFDADAGAVVRFDVPGDRQQLPSLNDAEVSRLAELARDIESAFGYPVDVEWAIDDTDGQIALLQARPETVWSNRDPASDHGAPVQVTPPRPEPAHELTVESWDPLHAPSAPDVHWSTSNVAEAMPGVLTPLSWTLWQRVLEKASLNAPYQMGAFSRQEAQPTTDVNKHWFRAFYGRPALQVRYLATIGDRLPGTSGEQAVESVLGRVPENWSSSPTMRRLPVIAWRLPRVFIKGPAEIKRTAAAVDKWYPLHLALVDSAETADEAVRLFQDAAEKFENVVRVQVLGALAAIIPVYSALERVIERRGAGDIGRLSGFGGAEVTGLVTDMWRASRGEISLQDTLARIGFHGPLEGEMSSRVWREDPTPLRDLIAAYALQDAAKDPRRKAVEHAAAAKASAAELLAATPTLQRPLVKALVKLAEKRVPLRGVAKRALLQALDGARAAARRLGELRFAAGEFVDPSDVFYLTERELSAMPTDVESLVARRRARRAHYETLSLPRSWKGMPTPQATEDADTTKPQASENVEGIGVSAGVVEGIARVLHSPDFSAVTAGDVLVTPTTDPSWSSVMLLSSALVVDIGGSLSHAAVVARELGVPCVVNTRTGTSVIRTGDRVRVDGRTGLVEILERASTPSNTTLAPEGHAS